MSKYIRKNNGAPENMDELKAFLKYRLISLNVRLFLKNHERSFSKEQNSYIKKRASLKVSFDQHRNRKNSSEKPSGATNLKISHYYII